MKPHSRDVPLRERTFTKDAPGYEEARRKTMWNARLPGRYPTVIIQARDIYDVVSAVKRARREGLRIGVRSGGHSWAGNHVRDGGLLLDVSLLDEVSVDKAAMLAIAGPGHSGHALAARLGRQGLFFPTGHCRGVCIGGYLLQGGFGWHSRTLGPACMSVVGLDIVTADGEIVHASADENPDLYWAARGSGPGFFGVVVRFHLRLYPKPKLSGFAFQSFPISMLEEVFRWAFAVAAEVPDSVEMQLMVSRNATGVRGAGIEVFSAVFADGLRAALSDLSFMSRSPLRKQAAFSVPLAPAPLSLMYRAVMSHYPDEHRWAVDNMWTHASIDELLPGIQRIADTLPAAPSHMLWLNWRPPKQRPDMAFSMEDDSYIACYGGWKHAQDDGECKSWAETNMRAMQHLASGVQLADENLGQRPARFVSEANLARLDEIRKHRDPEGRFYPWMGRP